MTFPSPTSVRKKVPESKILVTGGGFIGSNFVRECTNHSVTVLDPLSYADTLVSLGRLPSDRFT